MPNLRKYYPILLILFGTALSCLVGFINGYPLVYPDTGEYLNSGFEAVPPYDRTIFYGLFARHISLFFSLWIVIFVQGILINYLLYQTTDIFFSGKKKSLVFLFTVVFLNLSTGLSYNVSIIMPDIFSPISILCLIVLLLHTKLRRYEIIFISVIFIYSIATQVSSFPIFSLLFILLFIYIGVKKIRKKYIFLDLKRFLLSFLLFLGSLILVPAIHFILGGKFTLSNGSHVFMMNHLLETGVLKSYLDDSCGQHNYKICAYKDKLGYNLMWELEGPLYKTGGWEANKKEYNDIITNVFTTPKYLERLTKKGIKYSFNQFFTYETTVAQPQLENSAPYGQIEWRFKKELRNYISSLQNNGKINTKIINSIQSLLIPFCMLFVLTCIVINYFIPIISPQLKWAIFLIVIYCIISSIVCSNLSTIDARYQNRLVWLFPFISTLCVTKWLEAKSIIYR